MEFNRAIEILNREKHLGFDDWRYAQLHTPGVFHFAPVVVACHGGEGMATKDDLFIHASEAIRIAEEYEIPMAFVATTWERGAFDNHGMWRYA